jgi:hypothetical protein
VVIRTDVARLYPYRQEEVPAEDYGFFARLIACGHRFANIPEALYMMRIHPASASSQLAIDTIHKTYTLRKELFGLQTPVWKQWLYFLHILFYRKYLLHQQLLPGYFYLVLSSLCYPGKVFRRLRITNFVL